MVINSTNINKANNHLYTKMVINSNKYQQNKQSPLNSDGQPFQQISTKRTITSHLYWTNWTQETARHIPWEIHVLALNQAEKGGGVVYERTFLAIFFSKNGHDRSQCFGRLCFPPFGPTGYSMDLLGIIWTYGICK